MSTALTRRDFLAASAGAAAGLATRPAFAQSADPADLTIAEAQRLVRRRDLSPLELVEATPRASAAWTTASTPS